MNPPLKQTRRGSGVVVQSKFIGHRLLLPSTACGVGGVGGWECRVRPSDVWDKLGGGVSGDLPGVGGSSSPPP